MTRRRAACGQHGEQQDDQQLVHICLALSRNTASLLQKLPSESKNTLDLWPAGKVQAAAVWGLAPIVSVGKSMEHTHIREVACSRRSLGEQAYPVFQEMHARVSSMEKLHQTACAVLRSASDPPCRRNAFFA